MTDTNTWSRPARTDGDADIGEVLDLVKAYAKQETIGPLRGLGRYLGFGMGGALLLFIGILLLGIGLLRLLQTETDTTFTGSLSWIPYLIVAAVFTLLAVLFAWRITKHKRTL